MTTSEATTSVIEETKARMEYILAEAVNNLAPVYTQFISVLGDYARIENAATIITSGLEKLEEYLSMPADQREMAPAIEQKCLVCGQVIFSVPLSDNHTALVESLNEVIEKLFNGLGLCDQCIDNGNLHN